MCPCSRQRLLSIPVGDQGCGWLREHSVTCLYCAEQDCTHYWANTCLRAKFYLYVPNPLQPKETSAVRDLRAAILCLIRLRAAGLWMRKTLGGKLCCFCLRCLFVCMGDIRSCNSLVSTCGKILVCIFAIFVEQIFCQTLSTRTNTLAGLPHHVKQYGAPYSPQ